MEALAKTCTVCGAASCVNPGFCRSCRRADRAAAKQRNDPALKRLCALMVEGVRIDRAWRELNRAPDRVSASTVEALMYSLRERGTKALEEPDTKRRLSQCSDEQVIEVGNRLQRLDPKIARAWSADEVRQLIRARQ
jgi:transposase